MIFTKSWLLGALERATKTAAQSLAAMFIVGVGIFEIDWVQALDLTAAVVIGSLITSIGNADFTAGTTTSTPTDTTTTAG